MTLVQGRKPILQHQINLALGRSLRHAESQAEVVHERDQLADGDLTRPGGPAEERPESGRVAVDHDLPEGRWRGPFGRKWRASDVSGNAMSHTRVQLGVPADLVVGFLCGPGRIWSQDPCADFV